MLEADAIANEIAIAYDEEQIGTGNLDRLEKVFMTVLLPYLNEKLPKNIFGQEMPISSEEECSDEETR